MVIMMLIGAAIASIFFAVGYKFGNKTSCIDMIDVSIKDHIEPIPQQDLSAPFRIKQGPKKGLLSYKRAR